MNVGIIGGTGPAGQALSLRLAVSGVHVVLGSRDEKRSESVVEQLQLSHSGRVLEIVSGSNRDAASCELVVLATPWEGAISVAISFESQLAGKVLISMVNALTYTGGEFQALLSSRGSIAASLQAVLPDTTVVAAFQHLPARELGLIDEPFEADVMICSDTQAGFSMAESLIARIDGLRPVFCGSLASATAIEAMTATLLNINVRYKAHVSIRLTGF